MAIYTESAVQYNGVQRESIEDMINDDRVVPSESDDFVSEGMEIILGMTENYNMVMEHVGRSELLALEQTGEQLVYTEGVISGIFGTIKKFLNKVWEKIKSLFKRFIMMIDSYTKNDKAFVNKYRQQIYRHKSLSDFTFKGYVYTIDTGKISAMMQQLRTDSDKRAVWAASKVNRNNYSHDVDYFKNLLDKFDDEMETVRGNILAKYPKGKAGKFTSEEFRKELGELLRNGESEKQDLDGSNSSEIDVDTMVTELQNYRETKKTIDTTYKESKKAIDNDSKEIERLQKEHINTTVKNPDDIVNIKGRKGIGLKQRIGRKWSDRLNVKQIKQQLTSDGYTDIKDTDLNNAGTKNIGEVIQVSCKDSNGADVVLKFKVVDKENGQILASYTNSEIHQIKGKRMHYLFRQVQAFKQILVDIDTIVLQALKERSRQYKACLVKIVYHNPKNEESYNESYSYHNQFQQNFTSPLSNIEFK